MTKVWKSVGAVAIYSRPRAVLLGVLLVLAVAGLGFVAGIALGGDDDSGDSTAAEVRTETETATETVTTEVTTTAPAENGDGSGSGSGGSGSYRQGANDVFGDLSDFRVGGAYMIRLQQGANGARFQIGPHVTVEPGRTYFLCGSGSQRLCVRR